MERNEKVLVSCELAAKPAEITFHWAFNNSLGDVSSAVKFASSASKSLATIVVTGRDGYGMLSCWGRTRIGTNSMEPCTFYVIPAGNKRQNEIVLCLAHKLPSLPLSNKA